LLRINALSVFCLLVILSFFNWDRIIAKYNFGHANQSFVHFDFLCQMNDSSLPYLDKDLETLQMIEAGNDRFPSKIEYMDAAVYYDIIQSRKLQFIENQEKQHWLSWNLASAQAYTALQQNAK
jgi:hypothetical protein